MATGRVDIPGQPSGFTRRELLLGSGGLLAGGIIGGATGTAFLPMLAARFEAPTAVDPFWTQGIWRDTTEYLRRPGRQTGSNLPSGGGTPGLLPAVHADELPRQNIQLYYFSEKDKRFHLPAELEPEHDSGALCFSTELLFFNPSRAQFQAKEKYGTFRMDVGNALKPDESPFGLFMTGMNVFHLTDQGAALNQTVFAGSPPVVVPEGVARLSFNFWRTKPNSWWTRIFGFLNKAIDKLPVLFPSIVIPAAVKPALELVNSVIGNSEAADKHKFDYLWRSGANSLALTKEGKTKYPLSYSLRSGLWVVVDDSNSTHLEDDPNLVINPGRFFLARRQDQITPIMAEFNYLVWRCKLQPARLATETSCIYHVAE